MKEPAHFPFAFKLAMAAIGTIYMFVMCGGYYGYGEFLQSDLIASLTAFPANAQEAFSSPTEWTGPVAPMLNVVISCLLFVKLLIGLPLIMMVIFHSFQTFQYTRDVLPVGSLPNRVMRLVVACCAVLSAQTVSNFNQLFALVCAVFFPLMQCILPIFFSYKIREACGAPASSWLRRVLHAFMIMLALLTLTIGTHGSVSDILEGNARSLH